MIKIGISGKRQIPSGEIENIYRDIKLSIRDILKKNNQTEFIGYTALAIGADTIFAEVVKKEFQQPLRIVLPFDLQEYKKDFMEADLEVVERLIKENGTYQITETTLPTDNNKRNLAYYKVGKTIVDECDEMVIVWDGLKPEGQGGTAEILGYLSEQKPGKAINCVSFKSNKNDALHEEILQAYERSNQNAIAARDLYKRVWKSAIVLGWLVVLCFAVKIGFDIKGFPELLLTSVEFVLILSVFFLFYTAKKKNYHGKYLQERMKAETLRLLLCYYHADIEIKISKKSLQNDNKVTVLASKINQEMVLKPRRSKWYAQYVITSLIDEQCTYHTNKAKIIGNKAHNFERTCLVLGGIFLINLSLHFVSSWAGELGITMFHYPHNLSIFLSIILPATYVSLEGFSYFNEWALIKNYSVSAKQSLTESMSLLPKDLEACDIDECHKKQTEVLNLVSSIMLTDNRNWNLILENKKNYHLIV